MGSHNKLKGNDLERFYMSKRRKKRPVENRPRRCDNLVETTYSNDEIDVDEDAGIIRNVKILGPKSRNGRDYSVNAMEQASKFYEGIQVNIDHPDPNNPGKERGVVEGIGVIRSPRVEKTGVYGDLHYLTKHRDSPVIVERAQKMPNTFGLSHNATGNVRSKDGRDVVEEIESVRSVDIVSDPATNSGLFESMENKKMTTLLELFREHYPDTAGKALLEIDAIGMDPMMDAPAEASPVEAVKAAVADQAVAVILDDSIDNKATKKEVNKLIDTIDVVKNKLEGGTGDSESEPAETTEEPTPESWRGNARVVQAAVHSDIRDTVQEMKRKDMARDVLESHGLTLSGLSTPHKKLILSQADEDSMHALVESWPASVRRNKTRPIVEGLQSYGSTEDKCPDGYDEYAKAHGFN